MLDTTFTKQQEIKAQESLTKELDELNKVKAALTVVKKWYDESVYFKTDKGEVLFAKEGEYIDELFGLVDVYFEANAENTEIHTVEGWQQYADRINTANYTFEADDGKKYMVDNGVLYKNVTADYE